MMACKGRVQSIFVIVFIICAVYLSTYPLVSRSYNGLFQQNAKVHEKQRKFSVLGDWDHKNHWPNWTSDYSLQPWLTHRQQSVGENVSPLERRFPTVIGVGTKKCGTGPLQYFLKSHPNFKTIEIPGKLEGHFFDSPKYAKGLEYYRSLMPMSSVDDVVFEKSPRYFFSAKVPSRIVEWNKDVKIILVVCDPVLRAFSDYTFIRTTESPYRRKTMSNFTSFDDYVNSAIADMEEIKGGAYKTFGFGTYHSFIRNVWNERTFQLTPITNGMYAIHLNDWYTYFPRNQIHVMDGEKLISDPGSVIEDVQKFMGLDVTITAKDFKFDSKKGFYCLKKVSCMGSEKGLTRGANVQGPSTYAVERLKKFYNPINKDFFLLVNKTFNWL